MNTKTYKIGPKFNGIELYNGPSMLDGSPIIAVLILKSMNSKTGDMMQLHIIRADMAPLMASKKKLDAAICGNCPHKHSDGGACYVNIGQGPTVVYKTWKAGKYPVYTSEHDTRISSRKVRLGAYGDPAAVPYSILKHLTDTALGFTGYTHQIDHPNFDSRVLEFCQISTDTEKQTKQAYKYKRGTFRVVTDKVQALPYETECLADSKGIECRDCMQCDGTSNIFILVHGSRKSNFLNNNIIARG
jgi:hypothetical protein